MRVFESFVDFIKHYDTKVKIPSSIAIKIKGKIFYFRKISINNNFQIQKGQIDRYVFREDSDNSGIELIVTYYRYFEAKIILEAYLLFLNDREDVILSPVYFFDSTFINEEDFNHFKRSMFPDAIINRINLKWVNTHFIPDAFMKYRNKAYREAKKTLFYELPAYLSCDDFDPPNVIEQYQNRRKEKWHINEHGKSHYFGMLETPTYWGM